MPSSTWAEARTRISPDHAVVLWRPGCPFCADLRRGLGGDDRITWVDVWEDPEAGARVRELNGGDELVPTVVVGDQVLRNPSVRKVLRALS